MFYRPPRAIRITRQRLHDNHRCKGRILTYDPLSRLSRLCLYPVHLPRLRLYARSYGQQSTNDDCQTSPQRRSTLRVTAIAQLSLPRTLPVAITGPCPRDGLVHLTRAGYCQPQPSRTIHYFARRQSPIMSLPTKAFGEFSPCHLIRNNRSSHAG